MRAEREEMMEKVDGGGGVSRRKKDMKEDNRKEIPRWNLEEIIKAGKKSWVIEHNRK